MTEVTRPSGITVSIAGPAEVTRTEPPPRRGAKVANRPAVGSTGDGGVVLDALRTQDFEVVDAIPLRIPPAAGPRKRGVAAPSSTVTLDVPVGTDEQAVVLLEDEGEYRWIVNGTALPRAAPKRGARAGSTKRQVRFSIDVKAAPPPPAIAVKGGRVKRNWVVDKLFGKVTAFVLRFAVKRAGKSIVKFFERNVEQGLVAIGSPNPEDWRLLGGAAALPFAMPTNRPARLLLLVHGTFSSTVGSFGALGIVPKGRDFLGRALKNYDAVLGFDHRTLSVDPLQNATDLLARLRRLDWPQPPLIEMIAYSRGGLVARSLVEHLLPRSRWDATIGRIAFVGCTNGGTQLAEPDNWHRFADYHTNLALGAARILSFIPGAQGWTTVAGQVIRGVGALIKALASGVVTDKGVPGLAAMQPDGEFVETINETQTGQPAAQDAQYFAVTSDFDPGEALAGGTTAELPPKLLMRIADWGADELLDEPNDLVVHVSSMTEIDRGSGDYVKDKLEYGRNGAVYHTNYFTRDATAAKFVEWFALSGVTPAMRKRGGRKVGAAIARHSKLAPGRRAASKSKKARTLKKAASKRKAPAKRKSAKKAALRKTAPAKRTRKRAATSALLARPVWRYRGKVMMDAFALSARGTRVRSTKRPVMKSGTAARAKAAKARNEPPPPPTRSSSSGRGEAPIECHFRAEMDKKVVVNEKARVDVTIARRALEAAAGRAVASARASVEAGRKLSVQIAERRNFRVEGKRWVEVDIPKPDTEANVSFEVTGLVAGKEGELWVQVRQGPVPLVTMKLKPRIVAAASAVRAPRLAVEHKLAAMPAPESPLDELLIAESHVGKSVQYRYFLNLPSLRIRKHFESPVIAGRDRYVVKILDRIGRAWAGSGRKELAAFRTDLRSIGAMMFTQLMPREMQQLLWEKHERITGVQVFSMEPFIPWELIYLKDPHKDVISDDSKFLGELGLVRWLYDGYPPARIRLGSGRARYIIPTYTGDDVLPEAANEERMLKQLFKAKRVPAKAYDVQKLIGKPGSFDLLHFGGHAEAAGHAQTDARLVLDQADDGGTENALLATTVEQTARLNADGRQPIVVLNACESARNSRGFARMGGFASAFVARGAGVFIGTQWSVGDAPARIFIEKFYKSFAVRKKNAKPRQLVEAVLQARHAARDGGDATWLAYVVYGHPRAVVN